MPKIMGMFLYLRSRLSEPSSLVSIAALGATVGVKLDASLLQDVLNIVSIVFGMLGFFVSEAKPLTKV